MGRQESAEFLLPGWGNVSATPFRQASLWGLGTRGSSTASPRPLPARTTGELSGLLPRGTLVEGSRRTNLQENEGLPALLGRPRSWASRTACLHLGCSSPQDDQGTLWVRTDLGDRICLHAPDSPDLGLAVYSAISVL